MNVDVFAQQIQALHSRLATLYQDNSSKLSTQPNFLLSIAFKELGTASEILQLAAEQLYQQNEILAATRTEVAAQRQRYQDLFEFIPNAYLVTDIQGKILEANRGAAKLLNLSAFFLANKLLINFIAIQGRQAFRAQLAQLQRSDWVQELSLPLQPINNDCFDASLTVTSSRNLQTNQKTLRWIIRDITEHQRALKALESHKYEPTRQKTALYIFTLKEN